MSRKRPIGIFDSGIGGLTVASAIQNALPSESIIYFGDTAHLPYGDKSAESVRNYSMGITKFLMDFDCKAIVIACNTASARGAKSVSKYVGDKIPVVNVIDPIANHVGRFFAEKKVGVIATKGTINSRVYPRRIHGVNESVNVVTKATPLLAPMIEEGFYNNNISKAVIHSYLDHPSLKNIDGVVLGCTHYPLIRTEVEEFFDDSVKVMDSAYYVAEELKSVLTKTNLLASDKKPGEKVFYVSDFTDSFRQSAKQFFGSDIELKEARIWDEKG